MKRNLKLMLLLITSIVCLNTITAAQATPTPTPNDAEHFQTEKVVVDQAFVEDAARAFDLVDEQKKALEKYAAQEVLTDAERRAAEKLIAGLNQLVAVKDRTIAALEHLNKLYADFAAFQEKVLTRLMETPKKKSLGARFLQGLRQFFDALKAAALVYLGAKIA